MFVHSGGGGGGWGGTGGEISRESGRGKDNDSCIRKRITWVPPVIMYLPLWDYTTSTFSIQLAVQSKALKIPSHA